MEASDNIVQTAREYLRVSVDRSGHERSPEEQHSDNARAARGRGWTLVEPSYRDIGSASRFSQKAREGFDKLMSDLESGAFDAEVLILWESSRGSRRVSEWARLVELAEKRGVRFFITSDSKIYDPADGRDRRSLLEDAVDAEYESSKTSKRTKRNAAAQAVDGQPHGRAPFGYIRLYDGTTGALEKQIPHPKEAEIVKELYRQLHRGVSLRAVARDFEQRGFRSRSGKVFHPAHLRTLALKHVYAGLRVHDPKRKGHKLSPDAVFTEGKWPALVTRRVFLTVTAKLTAPTRKTTRPGRGVHLLSHLPGAVVCDACDGVLAARPSRGNYSCAAGGHVSVGYADLDSLVESEVVEYLSRPDNLAQLVETDDDELERARDAVTDLETELRDLAGRVGRGELSAQFAAVAAPGIEARLDAARRLEAELSTPSVLSGLIEPGQPVAKAWAAMPMSAKRTVVKVVCSQRLLGQVRVLRSPLARHRVAIEERVLWHRGEQETSPASGFTSMSAAIAPGPGEV